MAKNIYGNSSFAYCNFLYNKGSGFYHGGNGLVEFIDCLPELSPIFLEISHSIFSFGSCVGCNTTYNIVLASGLSIIMSCTNVHLRLYNVTMTNNSNTFEKGYGGNLFIHFFNDTNFTSNIVQIQECNIVGGSSHLGGGIHIAMYTQERGRNHTRNCMNSLTVVDTNIAQNIAITGGGLYINIHDITTNHVCPALSILLRNTTFSSNIIKSSESASLVQYCGAGIHILNAYTLDFLYKVNALNITMFNITIQGSLVSDKQYANDGVVAIYSIKFLGSLTLRDVRILNNAMSGIGIIKGQPLFKGEVIIINNTGVNGGGMSLCESSYLTLAHNTTVIFTNNHANYGGGIYAEESCDDPHPSCFYQFQLDYVCQRRNRSKDIASCYGTQVIMTGNNALYGGDDIFGSNVARCSFLKSEDYVGFNTFYSIFNMSKNVPGHLSAVSSKPIKVCFCQKPQIFDCSEREILYHKTVFPGESVTISLVLAGQLDGTVGGIVSIGNSVFVPITQTKVCKELKFRVNKTLNYKSNVTLQFGKSNPEYSVLNKKQYTNTLPLRLQVSFKDCPIGFVLNNNRCDCPKHIRSSFKCFISNQTIQRIDYGWIGYNKISSKNYRPGLFYHEYCPFDYCNSFKTFMHSTGSSIDTDAQCSKSRSGILCGACKKNFTIAINSNQCLNCTRYNKFHALLIILAFMAVQLFSIAMLFALNISITDGTLSGLLFYANILYSKNILFQFDRVNMLTVIISWLNLDAGFSFCLYDGMDMYMKAWLLFITPTFMWLSVVVLVLLSKKYKRVATLLGGNTVKVLATLLELSYYRTIQACIIALSYTVIKYPSWNHLVQKYVWLYDANVDYFQGKHIPLFLTACLFSVSLILYTSLLLFVQPLLRYSHWRCLSWFNNLKPLIDAYTAPDIIKPKCRFWTGLLLLMRIFLAIHFSAHLDARPERDLVGIIVGCVLILAISTVFGGVYKSSILNILNTSFFVNLTYLSVTNLFHLGKLHHCFGCKHENLKKYSFYPSAAIAVMTMTSILLYYLYKRVKKIFNRKNGVYSRLLDVKEDTEIYSRVE